jgi:hypothetical protein
VRRSYLSNASGLWLALSLVAGTSPALRAAPPSGTDAKGVEFFETQIRPILADKCYQCHSQESKKAKGGLLLDNQEGLLKGGDSGPLFVAGDSEKSLLLKAVRYKDEDLRMPPDGKKLTAAQVADLEAWVKMGAPLPQAGVAEDKIKARARTHWAFQPVKPPAIPTVKDQRWVQSPVDAFILAKLEPAGMQPAQPADKRILIRRATYDLIGLPPTPEEVAAFVADKSPDAFATVVDRLLASPHYGERWGRYWHKYDPIPTRDYYSLHGVFASSTAPDEMPVLGIPPDPNAYADYLQKRKPLQAKWDEFVRKQETDMLKQHRQLTAQYLLLSRDPAKLAELEGEAFGLSDRKILRTGAPRWLKALEKLNPESDPIFAPWFAFAALPTSEFADRAKALSAKLAADTRPLNSLVVKALTREPPTSLKEVAERYGKLFEDVDKRWQERLEKDAESQKLADADEEALRQVFYGKDSPGNLPAELIPSLYNVPALMQVGPLRGQLMGLDGNHPGAPQRAMALVDSPRPTNSRVFIRGNPTRLGEEVPRQFLAILAGDKRQPFTRGSGRLELAKAIASRDNPLTARVMVDRVWLHHFGASLATTPDDFGLRSEPPSHPELLDYLAWRFVQDGWSVKKLHRVLMLSSVYQQKSDDGLRHEKLDPDNRLLAKAKRRRLDAESMRDTLLFVAGNLDPSAGGRPVDLFKQREGSLSNRRTVYGSVDRNDLANWFRTFDFANPDNTTARRDATTVPQQALFFLNGPFVMEQASKLVNRPAFRKLDDDTERVRYLYQHVYQRDPSANEIKLGIRFDQGKSDSTDFKGQQPLTQWERYAQVLLMSNELMFVD